MTVTIRSLLFENSKQDKEPQNIHQLHKITGVSRSIITKIQDGDYANVRPETLQRIFAPLGYRVTVDVKVEED